MALSGSVDFNNTRDEIITDALRLAGLLEAEETPEAAEVQDASRALNRMVKAWQADGFHLWKMKEATLFLTKGTAKYTLGPGGDHCTETFAETTLSADAAAGAATISITSATGMSASDNIGIVLDDGTFDWDTISGSPSTTITLGGTLTSAASSGNKVYAYTSKINRPLRITDARRHDSSDQDTPFVDMLSRDEYFDLPNKTTQGKSVQAYYDPQLTNGLLYLWPAPDSIDDVVKFTFADPVQDFDAASENPDFPQEWLEGIVWNLAYRLGTEYDTPLDKLNWIKANADPMKDAILAWDTEGASVFFQAAFGA